MDNTGDGVSDLSDTARAMVALDLGRARVLVGFDGFVDTVVGMPGYETMLAFSKYLAQREGRSGALELKRKGVRPGGNAVNTARALGALGIYTDCVAALGAGEVSPLFSHMPGNVKLHTVGDPGTCLALEFDSGKLFLADNAGISSLSWQTVAEAAGLSRLRDMAAGAKVICLANWGELPNMHGIWQGFARDVLAHLPVGDRILVFDLADISARGDEDIRAVLELMAECGQYARTVLSVNDNELDSLRRACGVDENDQGLSSARQAAGVDMLVHHSLGFARAHADGREVQGDTWRVGKPALTTGGGDHFNAGLILGLAAELVPSECLRLGNAVASLYVQHGKSPGMDAVLARLDSEPTIING